MWSGKRVTSQVADRAVVRSAEGGRIEPLVDGMRIEAAVEVRIDVRTYGVAGVPAAGGVIAKLRREGKARLQIRDAADRRTDLPRIFLGNPLVLRPR